MMKRCEKHFNAGDFQRCWNAATQWTMHGIHKAFYCDHCAQIVRRWGCEMQTISPVAGTNPAPKMILRLIGGPKDGAEIEFPLERLSLCSQIHIPIPIINFALCLSDVKSEDDLMRPAFLVAAYKPIPGEIGDLEFCGYR